MAVVTGVLREGTQVSVRARDFTWLGDEPTSAGGTDTGPTPYEILLGSLAACITITLRLYADHKGIPLRLPRHRTLRGLRRCPTSVQPATNRQMRFHR